MVSSPAPSNLSAEKMSTLRISDDVPSELSSAYQRKIQCEKSLSDYPICKAPKDVHSEPLSDKSNNYK